MAAKPDPLSMQRGDYGTNLAPTLLFIAGRAITGPIQYYLITKHPLSVFGVPPPPTGSPPIHLFGRIFPRLPFLTALMPGVLSLKHIFWLSFLIRERVTMPFAFFGVLADIIYESITSLVFTTASVNPMFSQTFVKIGSSMYFAGVFLELTAELQRAAFKAKKENEGKLCTTGLWGITRHINFTANVLFAAGYGLATGGPLYAIPTAGMYVCNFVFNAIPSLEDYCRGKYGKEWERYERDVRWQLIPGIY